MEEKITLRFEELFFLGELMDAEYLDYSYIASMGEIQHGYEVIRGKCLQNLARRRIITQRLSGDVTVQPTIRQLLRSVFFGKLETRLDVTDPTHEMERQTWRYHSLNGATTLVRADGGVLTIEPSTASEQQTLLRYLIGIHPGKIRSAEQLVPSSVSRTFFAQRAEIDIGRSFVLLVEQNGGLYTADGEHLTGISDAQGTEILLNILKGE